MLHLPGMDQWDERWIVHRLGFVAVSALNYEIRCQLFANLVAKDGRITLKVKLYIFCCPEQLNRFWVKEIFDGQWNRPLRSSVVPGQFSICSPQIFKTEGLFDFWLTVISAIMPPLTPITFLALLPLKVSIFYRKYAPPPSPPQTQFDSSLYGSV